MSIIDLKSDERFMQEAFKEAKQALEMDEVPVGAVLTCNGIIISRAHNQTVTLKDPTAHAEVLCITAACASLGSEFLKDCTLYVTLEPCIMCAGATVWSKVGKIVYGASDVKNGAFSKHNIHMPKKMEQKSGIMEEECAEILQNFFREKRLNN